MAILYVLYQGALKKVQIRRGDTSDMQQVVQFCDAGLRDRVLDKIHNPTDATL